MFVAIDNSDMSVPQVLDWINRTKNANNNVISPELLFLILMMKKKHFLNHLF